MRRLCSTVLGMEAVILLLAIVPAKVLEHISGGTAALVGGGLALLAILLAGVVGRPPDGLGAVRRLGAAVPGDRLRRDDPRDVRPRRDLRSAMVHRHLASPQSRIRPAPPRAGVRQAGRPNASSVTRRIRRRPPVTAVTSVSFAHDMTTFWAVQA